MPAAQASHGAPSAEKWPVVEGTVSEDVGTVRRHTWIARNTGTEQKPINAVQPVATITIAVDFPTLSAVLVCVEARIILILVEAPSWVRAEVQLSPIWRGIVPYMTYRSAAVTQVCDVCITMRSACACS